MGWRRIVKPEVNLRGDSVVLLTLEQWFPNFLASDPKEKLDIRPGPKLVKTADLQAHNASLRAALRACRSAVFTNS